MATDIDAIQSATFVPPHLRSRLMLLAQNRMAPRHPAFVQHALSRLKQPVSLYGAGTHSLQLMSLGLKVNRVFDHLGAQLKTFPLPVHPLEAWRPSDGPLLLSHAEHECSMRDGLDQRGIPYIPLYTNERWQAECSIKFPGIARIPAAKKPRIAIIHAQARGLMNPAIQNGLKKHFELYSIGALTRRQPSCSFDFDSKGSLIWVQHALNQLQPDLTIIEDHFPAGNLWPLFIKALYPHMKTVFSCYDLLRYTFDDPYVLAQRGFWNEQDVALALLPETTSNLHAFLVKDSCRDLPGASHQMLPAHSTQHFLPPQRESQAQGLVYAGHIAAEHADPVLYGDNQLYSVFSALTRAGMSVDAFTTTEDTSALALHYPSYLDLAKQAPFRLFSGMPLQALLLKLNSNYLAGLQFGHPHPQTQQTISHPVTVSAKIFSYAAAGIPMVVGRYLAQLSHWVESYQMGWVLEPGEEHHLPGQLRQRPRPHMLRGIDAFRRATCQEEQIKGLIPFLRKMF